ncbi:MAG: hypothetical protein IKQ59_04525 [Prevotella sp.]|nr:hypothetical protein [Prevotella sp.]
MKKTYLIPQTIVAEIQLHKMIAGSGGNRLMNPENDGYAKPDGDVLSRRRNVWEDDEEEEDF